ncbi:MAG TPA: SIS domain-containing protein [Anaerolineaceae bacterium]|nr:SIS domain-containing protein [Anaerolineaceae bacterium]
MTEELIPMEIQAIPVAIQATVRETRAAAREAAAAMRARSPRRIYFIGNGTSLYSSMAAAYTARLLAGPAGPLVLAWQAGDFNYYTPQVNEEDIVVGVSASGEFRDVLTVFERLEGKCLRVGITHVPGSSIVRVCDQLLISYGGPSRVPVMTKTYASTLTAEHLLLLEFFQAGQSYFDSLLQTADLVEVALIQADQKVPAWVEMLKTFGHAFYFGAGPAQPAALEGALKMKEMALLHAEGNETWETASGAATLIGADAFCVAMDAGGAGQAATRSLGEGVRKWGATLLTIGPEQIADGEHLPVGLPGCESFASLVLVPPAALLAYRLARARGVNPNQPGWRDRYYSQGMTHILG